MNLGIEGKVALVCGGSKGMGFAIAKELHEEGATVAILSRDKKNLDNALKEISSIESDNLMAVLCDLSKIDTIAEAVDAVVKKFGQIDILINNAGGPKPGSFSDVSLEDYDMALNQNLKSVIYLTHYIAPKMKENKWGRIINITSQVVKEPAPTMILSNTARAGVVAFAKSISHDLAPFNITVNTLCPGPIRTERMKDLIRLKSEKDQTSPEAIEKDIENRIPMKRIGIPEEFASIAVFLSSQKASYITGTTICVDGGINRGLL